MMSFVTEYGIGSRGELDPVFGLCGWITPVYRVLKASSSGGVVLGRA